MFRTILFNPPLYATCGFIKLAAVLEYFQSGIVVSLCYIMIVENLKTIIVYKKPIVTLNLWLVS